MVSIHDKNVLGIRLGNKNHAEPQRRGEKNKTAELCVIAALREKTLNPCIYRIQPS